jgi:hypothetical protein
MRWKGDISRYGGHIMMAPRTIGRIGGTVAIVTPDISIGGAEGMLAGRTLRLDAGNWSQSGRPTAVSAGPNHQLTTMPAMPAGSANSPARGGRKAHDERTHKGTVEDRQNP